MMTSSHKHDRFIVRNYVQAIAIILNMLADDATFTNMFVAKSSTKITIRFSRIRFINSTTREIFNKKYVFLYFDFRLCTKMFRI